MGGGDLNTKKSWHPNTMKNQERVWKAEQAEANEKRRIDDLRREMDSERSREELTQHGQASGVLAEKSNKKMDWMYKQPNESVDREQYLLGKKIDKTFEKIISEEKVSQSYVKPPPKNHVEHECIPFSIRNWSSDVDPNDCQVDMARKLLEDPLVAIRKRELESRAQLLQNPVKLKELTMLLKMDQAKSKKKKDKKNKKHKKDSSDIDKKLAEKLNKLKDVHEDSFDINGLLQSPSKALKKSSKKKKKKKKSSCSDSDTELDVKKKGNSKLRLEEPSYSNQKDSYKSHENTNKYDRSGDVSYRKSHQREEQTSQKKYEKNMINRKNSRQDSESNSDSSNDHKSKNRKRSTNYDFDGREITHTELKEKKRRHAIEDESWKSSTAIKKSKYSHSKLSSSLDSGDEYENRSKNYREYSDRHGKSNEDFKDKQNRKKEEKGNKSEKVYKSKNEKSDTYSHNKNNKSYYNESRNLKTPKDKHSDQIKPSLIISQRKYNDDSDEEDERPKQKHYGLVRADGSKIQLTKTEKLTASIAMPSKEVKKYEKARPVKLTEKEKEQKRKEMMENATERDKEREITVSKYRDQQKKIEELEKKQKYKDDFVESHLREAAKFTSVESRIKSNIYNIQRSNRHMDSNFARR